MTEHQVQVLNFLREELSRIVPDQTQPGWLYSCTESEPPTQPQVLDSSAAWLLEVSAVDDLPIRSSLNSYLFPSPLTGNALASMLD